MTTEPAERILLVGMMGSGKSTVGRRVATLLDWRFADTDEEVERITGRRIEDLFSELGEPAFRSEEARALRIALAGRPPACISVGGGAVLDASNRALMRDAGLVVWLRARPATLAERVGDGSGRPLLAGGAIDALGRLSEERQVLYAAVADAVVDVDGLTVESVAEQVAGLDRSSGSHPVSEEQAPR